VSSRVPRVSKRVTAPAEKFVTYRLPGDLSNAIPVVKPPSPVSSVALRVPSEQAPLDLAVADRDEHVADAEGGRGLAGELRHRGRGRAGRRAARSDRQRVGRKDDGRGSE